MNNNKNITFVVPTYNSEDTLVEAIDSIYNGNFENGDEVIIVDGASTDHTKKIVDKLILKYGTIKSIYNKVDKGLPANRNIGVRVSKNDLIMNLDSDNILVPGSVRRLREYLLKEGADIVAFSEYHYFFKKNSKKITHKWVYKPGVMTLADFLAGPITPGPGGNFMYTKKSWEKIGGYWEYGKGVQEAWGFTLKQLANGAKFVVLPDSYYLHRYGTNSLFVREAKDDNKSSIMATKMIMNFIDLINNDDVEYIKSDWGAKHWCDFDVFTNRPIRLKSSEVGQTGYKISCNGNIFLSKIKKRFPYLKFIKDFLKFRKNSKTTVKWKDRKAMLYDNTPDTYFDTHYIYHPAWAVRIVKKINPEFHIDISSTLTFSSILSAFIPVKFFDYRPANIFLEGLESKKANLLSLPFPDNSISSISCMHTIEHIGLGRYGDSIDSTADIKAINELKRVVKKGGSLIFVTPVGKSKIVFNAHRIYSYRQIMSYFDGFELKEFSLVPDNGGKIGIIKNADEKIADAQKYGCGCFWFVKK